MTIWPRTAEILRISSTCATSCSIRPQYVKWRLSKNYSVWHCCRRPSACSKFKCVRVLTWVLKMFLVEGDTEKLPSHFLRSRGETTRTHNTSGVVRYPLLPLNFLTIFVPAVVFRCIVSQVWTVKGPMDRLGGRCVCVCVCVAPWSRTILSPPGWSCHRARSIDNNLWSPYSHRGKLAGDSSCDRGLFDQQQLFVNHLGGPKRFAK